MPQSHSVVRGSIPQRVFNENVPTSDSTLHWSHFCLGHISRPKVAFPNTCHLAKSRRRAQHCAGANFVSDTFRGQRWHAPTHSNWQSGETSTICTGITVFPHVVIGIGIRKRTFTWQRLGSYPQSCCGGRSDFAVSRNRHPFVDVQSPRGDRQPSATFKRCAEISSHTEEMCSTTAPQGMQGKTFVAKTEERKEARKIFLEIAWRHAHQML